MRPALYPRPGRCVWMVCVFVGFAGAAGMPAGAAPPGWRTYATDFRVSGGGRVTHISLPPATERSKRIRGEAGPALRVPLAGFQAFVPFVCTDDTRSTADLFNADTLKQAPLFGTVYSTNPATDYAVAIFDTGAPLHIFSYADSESYRLNLRSGSNPPVPGASAQPIGAANPLISWPVGIYVTGLDAIDPADNTLDVTGMVGQSNVALPVGEYGDCPVGELPTVLGMPLAMFYAVHIDNDHWRFIRRTEQTGPPALSAFVQRRYFGPAVTWYDGAPGGANPPPTLAHRVPLTTTYVTNLALFLGVPELGPPFIPTLLNDDQNARLLIKTDFVEGSETLNDVDMILDSGAQLGILSPANAFALGLGTSVDPAPPDFLANVQGVCEVAEEVRGYFLDAVSIAPGLQFPRVAFLVRNIPGSGNGILGMNVFDDRDIVINADPSGIDGAYLDVSDPLGLSPCDLTRDHTVDLADADLFREVFSGSGRETTYPYADFDEDFDADFEDWNVLAAKIPFGSCAETPVAIEVVGDGPIDLLVTDPEGHRVSADDAEIFGGVWAEFDIDGDTTNEDVVQILSPVSGDYRVTVSAETGAAPGDTFTVQARVNGAMAVLAQDVRIDGIPGTPYEFAVEPCSASVPTVSPWGLPAMLVAFGAAAFIMMRRNRRVALPARAALASTGEQQRGAEKVRR